MAASPKPPLRRHLAAHQWPPGPPGTTAVVQLPGRRTTSSAADADAVQPQLTHRSLRAAPPPAAAAASPAASRLDLA
uniref:Uncharacterized protein n=1 Tax=Oryza barthii TaxID=65489 RepID=A0A0D3GST4_9ORYZ